MRKGRIGDRDAERAVFAYFEREEKKAAVPRFPASAGLPESGRRGRPAFGSLIAHVAVIAVCAALTAAFPAAVRVETPLRKAITAAVREGAYLKYLPSEKTLRESIDYFLNRRNKT